MILVADSGSTKTDWCLVENRNKRTYYQTVGMNPYIITSSAIDQEIEIHLIPAFDLLKVEKVFFYGAGCSTDEKKSFMQEVLQKHFLKAQIFVEHDLLAAARALCKKSPGIVGILGTGSNSCLYDGNRILENVPSLGYIFSDEGAGTHIGKLLLKAYLQHKFPENLREDFAQQFPGTESQLLDKVYKEPLPNRFLASLASFAINHKKDVYIRNLLNKAFDDFFEKQIKEYTNYQAYKIHLIGSVAFFLEEVIKEQAEAHGLEIGTILKAPLDALVDYHLTEN